MTEPTKFKDKTGRVRWQPTLANGKRLYWTLWGELKVWFPTNETSQPYLTGYRRAVRIAKREQKRRDRVFTEA